MDQEELPRKRKKLSLKHKSDDTDLDKDIDYDSISHHDDNPTTDNDVLPSNCDGKR